MPSLVVRLDFRPVSTTMRSESSQLKLSYKCIVTAIATSLSSTTGCAQLPQLKLPYSCIVRIITTRVALQLSHQNHHDFEPSTSRFHHVVYVAYRLARSFPCMTMVLRRKARGLATQGRPWPQSTCCNRSTHGLVRSPGGKDIERKKVGRNRCSRESREGVILRAQARVIESLIKYESVTIEDGRRDSMVGHCMFRCTLLAQRTEFTLIVPSTILRDIRLRASFLFFVFHQVQGLKRTLDLSSSGLRFDCGVLGALST